QFLTSSEYIVIHAGDTAFVQGLYQDTLGRLADPTGQTSWEGLLKNAVARADVARGFLTSTEHVLQIVDLLHQDLLLRDASAAERQAVATDVQAGRSLDSVMTGLLGSAEHQANLENISTSRSPTTTGG